MMTCAGCDLDLEKYREIQRSRGEGRHPEMKYSESYHPLYCTGCADREWCEQHAHRKAGAGEQVVQQVRSRHSSRETEGR